MWLRYPIWLGSGANGGQSVNCHIAAKKGAKCPLLFSIRTQSAPESQYPEPAQSSEIQHKCTRQNQRPECSELPAFDCRFEQREAYRLRFRKSWWKEKSVWVKCKERKVNQSSRKHSTSPDSMSSRICRSSLPLVANWSRTWMKNSLRVVIILGKKVWWFECL